LESEAFRAAERADNEERKISELEEELKVGIIPSECQERADNEERKIRDLEEELKVGIIPPECQERADNGERKISELEEELKGTLSRDFRPSVFFINQYPWAP
jgi:hypothetical protein